MSRQVSVKNEHTSGYMCAFVTNKLPVPCSFEGVPTTTYAVLLMRARSLYQLVFDINKEKYEQLKAAISEMMVFEPKAQLKQ